jgi:hypothetical protein
VTVANTTGSRGTSTAHHGPAIVHGAQDAVIATGEFRDLLAARNALASVAPGFDPNDRDGGAAPAAGEFAAVVFFRSAPLPDDQRTESGAQHAALGAASADTSAAQLGLRSDPNVAAQTLIEGKTLLPLAPLAGDAGIKTRGATQFVHSSSLQATATIEIEAGVGEAQLGLGEPDETVDPAPAPARQTPRERTQAGAFMINLAENGKTASVTGRVAGLAPGEADELDRRIRDELAAARLEARVIKINGRRTPVIGRE